MSHVSGSQVSGTAPLKKKRGRKAKNADDGTGSAGRSKEPTPSLVGGRAPTTVSGAGGDKDKDGAEDEDEADGPLDLVDANARTQEQKQEETRLRGMLVEAMDKEQEKRYEVWRAAKLPDAVVKRVSHPLPILTPAQTLQLDAYAHHSKM
jgi:transcription initiation factor TFIID subunit 11